MYRFKVNNNNEIKSFLQKSYIHDGSFLHAAYDQITKKFVVKIENRIWNDTINMEFAGVSKFLSDSDYKWGDDETINCLIVMDGTSELPKSINICDCTEKLCFIWELFSGNQIIIVCSELIVWSTGDGSMC